MDRLTDPGYIPERIVVNMSLKQETEIYKKLCEYENTGLTPEEIMDGKLLTGWIEVAERSPEDGQTVLSSNEEYVYLAEYDADWDAPYGDMDDIVAWMSLPEPYRPEE